MKEERESEKDRQKRGQKNETVYLEEGRFLLIIVKTSPAPVTSNHKFTANRKIINGYIITTARADLKPYELKKSQHVRKIASDRMH